MPKQEFEAKLERPEGVGTWTYFAIPRSEKVLRQQVPGQGERDCQWGSLSQHHHAQK